jgi:hypothetical protein
MIKKVNGNVLRKFTVFLMIWKRDRDLCVQKRPDKNDLL